MLGSALMISHILPLLPLFLFLSASPLPLIPSPSLSLSLTPCSVSELLMGEVDSSTLLSLLPTERSRVSRWFCRRHGDAAQQAGCLHARGFLAVSGGVKIRGFSAESR